MSTGGVLTVGAAVVVTFTVVWALTSLSGRSSAGGQRIVSTEMPPELTEPAPPPPGPKPSASQRPPKAPRPGTGGHWPTTTRRPSASAGEPVPLPPAGFRVPPVPDPAQYRCDAEAGHGWGAQCVLFRHHPGMHWTPLFHPVDELPGVAWREGTTPTWPGS